MDNRQHIRQLYQKFLDNRATPEETRQLLAYFGQSSPSDLRGLIAAELTHDEPIPDHPALEAKAEQLYPKIQQRIHRKDIHSGFAGRIRVWLPYAAAMLLFISVGISIYWYRMNEPPFPRLTSQYGGDVLPGGNHATLTLSDGSTIELDSAAIGLLAQQQGINITKSEDGTLMYGVQADGNGTETATAFNTITTPRGGQYRAILPDGSSVWLNAASSLTYPTRFAGSERKVLLEGEAYFDVAHHARRPFVVQSGKQKVRVVGTEFNIDAYGPSTVTTLVEGKVALNGNDGSSVILSAGEQAILTATNMEVRTVETGDYTAWKEGQIVLNEATLAEVAEQIERWYDVSVQLPDSANEKTAFIVFDRDERLSNILTALEETYKVRMEIEGRRLIIKE